MYDSAVGRFLSIDPLGIEAGDPNFYGYVDNNPTNFTDPTGLEKYRDDFKAATPGMPADWEVHHTLEQRLRERFAELGYKIDDLDFLRGMPPEIHKQISKLQKMWWSDREGIDGLTVDDVKLEDIQEFYAGLEDEFGEWWIEAGDDCAIQQKITKIQGMRASDNAIKANRRMTNALKNLGIAGTVFAILGLIAENASFAKNIVNPNENVQAYFQQMLVQYTIIYEMALQDETVGQGRWAILQRAILKYLREAGCSEKAVGIVNLIFERQSLELAP